MGAQQYFQHYKSKGFNFSNKVLTKYCLSLYTKPFVILSGISGTGKTKIAQLFETFVDVAVLEEPVQDFGYVILNITEGVINGDGRGNLKFKDLKSVFENEEIAGINEIIDDFKQRGVDDNITDTERFTVNTEFGNFQIEVYLQRANSPLLRVRFKSKRGDASPFDSQEFIKEHFNKNDVLKLEKIGRRQLNVISINDQSVIKVDQILDRKETELINNKLFVAVKSNWTDNTELFGYYNILEEKYNLTPLLKFMLTASEHPTKPFFLILDEMNLSKVEHYFSDFLSCIESRIVNDDDSISQENIQLHNYSSFVESNDSYYDMIPNSFGIPFNLYVTGTVNIDETTYAFSPKVLDRANVIEFNDVDIDNYSVRQDDNRFSLSNFPLFGVPKIASSVAFNSSPDEYKSTIVELLQILKPYNLHFGYRVINEMAEFVNNAIKHIDNRPEIINDAIDLQILQKILPKLSGSFGKLDEPLRKLIHYLVGEAEISYVDINIDYISKIRLSETRFPESLSKICRIYTNLLYNGFASFLE